VGIIRDNYFHQNNDGDENKMCGDGDNFMGMGTLVHPDVTFYYGASPAI